MSDSKGTAAKVEFALAMAELATAIKQAEHNKFIFNTNQKLMEVIHGREEEGSSNQNQTKSLETDRS
jgi:hypothetical protein